MARTLRERRACLRAPPASWQGHCRTSGRPTSFIAAVDCGSLPLPPVTVPLPVAPPPPSTDVAVLHWAALTVRVAWTLMVLGVKPRKAVVHEARTHALFHIDPSTPGPHAEDLAARHTEEFVLRAKGATTDDPYAQDWEMPVSPRWRRAMEWALDDDARTVFVRHYGDHRSLARLGSEMDLDRTAVDAIRSGLREVVRRIAVQDGLPLAGWTDERVDRMLKRLAAWSPGPCPATLDVAEGCHQEHVERCPRCQRMTRLLASRVLEVDDLVPPLVGARPTGRARVLALQVHPDARRSRRRLLQEIDAQCFTVADDLVLIDGDALANATPVLRTASECGLPERAHLRGALVEGPGQWSPRGLLGPLPGRARREVLSRSWGTIDGVGPLPEALPPPPSSRPAWAGVGVLAGLCALALALLRPATAPATVPLGVEFSPGRGGLWAVFDVPEEAFVTLVALRGGQLEAVARPTSPADKASLAAGDGSYRVHVVCDGLLLVASDAPIEQLEHRLAEAEMAVDPLATLARSLPEGMVASYAERGAHD